MVCLRGMARDMIDTNNLIEAFHYKLKYVYMKGRPKRRLDGEVYLLVEIVLRDIDFSVFLDDLNIGRMNPRQRQQQIREIAGAKISQNNIYNISSDTWIIRSMTNTDVEYSVRKNDSRDDLNLTLYVCTCRDFRTRQLPCKHIFAVLSRLQLSEDSEGNNQPAQLQQFAETNILDSSSSSYYPVNHKDKKKYEFEKLQEELAAIVAEWKDKSSEDIHSLRSTLQQAVQVERARIARVDIVPEIISDDESKTPNVVSKNLKFKKQSRY